MYVINGANDWMKNLIDTVLINCLQRQELLNNKSYDWESLTLLCIGTFLIICFAFTSDYS